jgi:hypothetical protein
VLGANPRSETRQAVQAVAYVGHGNVPEPVDPFDADGAPPL